MSRSKTPEHLLRKVRTYKATDQVYDKANNRAKSEANNLSNVIETFITKYGEEMPAVKAKPAKKTPKPPKAKPQIGDFE